VVLVDAHAGEQVAHLADGMDGHAGALQLVEVGAPGRRHREVLAPLGAAEGAGDALEGPRDHAPDGVLAGHRRARRRARRDEVVLAQHVVMGGELQHRIRGCVEDHLARLEVVLAPLLDDLGPAGRVVGAEAQAGDALERRHHVRWEAVRVGRQRRGRHDAHELPMAGGRLLAGTQRVQAPVDDGLAGRRHAEQATIEPAPAAEDRQVQAAGVLGEVGQRVGALVAAYSAASGAPPLHRRPGRRRRRGGSRAAFSLSPWWRAGAP
jgi:hypothetical protein